MAAGFTEDELLGLSGGTTQKSGGFSDEELLGLTGGVVQPQATTQPQTPVETSEPTFLERVESQLKNRQSELEQSFEDFDKGNINFGQTLLHVLGKGVFGPLADVGGEAISTAGKEAFGALPDEAQEMLSGQVSETLSALSNTDVGKAAVSAMESGWEGWETFKKGNPRLAKDIESIVNVGAFFAPPVKKLGTTGLDPLGSVAERIEKSGHKAIIRSREGDVTTMFMPVPTAEDMAKAREVGFFRKRVVIPNPKQKEMIQLINEKVPGIDEDRTFLYNQNRLQDYNETLAKELDARARASTVPVRRGKLFDEINVALNKAIGTNTLITGDIERVSEKLLGILEDALNKHPKTARGLLQARKDYDAAVYAQKKDAGFLSEKLTDLNVANTTIRNVLNDNLEQLLPGAKKQLREQHLLYEAIDNLGPKVLKEGPDAIKRTLSVISDLFTARRGAVMGISAAMGTSVLGAYSILSPQVLLGGVGGVLAAKVFKNAISSKGKVQIGKLVGLVNEAIKTSTNPDVIRQLRADRIILMDLLKTTQPETVEETE